MDSNICNNETKECPFCKLDNERKFIAESETAFAIYDKYPVSQGHALIIPKRHCTSYFELNKNEKIACWEMVDEIKKKIEKEFNPDGFNIGININRCSGQTIFHVHIHLIPRYEGDVKNPRGGVRGVIPNKKEY